METIFILFIVYALGFLSGWIQRERAAQKRVEYFFDKLQEHTEQEFDANSIKISIEKHNNVYYVYDSEKNQFMGQGSSRKELEKDLADKFPGKRFLADADNLKEVGFK